MPQSSAPGVTTASILMDANENKIILKATDFQIIFKGCAEYCVELLFLALVVPGVRVERRSSIA